MANLTPREENITGTSLNGTDGETSRTYNLAYDNPQDVRIFANGVFLHEDVDYSRSGQVITFTNTMWDDMKITFHYFTYTSTVSDDVTTTSEGVTRRYEYTKSREIVVDIIENVSDPLTGQEARSDVSHWILEGFPNQADLGKPAPLGWKFPIIIVDYPEIEAKNAVVDGSKQKITTTFRVEVHSRTRSEANELAEEIKYLLDVRGQDSLRTAALFGPDLVSSINEVDFIGGNKYYSKIMEYEFKRFD